MVILKTKFSLIFCLFMPIASISHEVVLLSKIIILLLMQMVFHALNLLKVPDHLSLCSSYPDFQVL